MENRRENEAKRNRADEGHNLYRLNELDDYEVADNDPDIRDWEVRSMDGNAIGKIKDLVVDTNAMKVRYIDVHLYDKVYKADDDKDMHLLVPIGAAALNEDKDDVVLDVIGSPQELQQQYPVCEGPILTPAYEERVKEYYMNRDRQAQVSDKDTAPGDKPVIAYDKEDENSFYNREYFDESRLHRFRKKK